MTIEEWHTRSAEDWFARNLSEDLSNEEKDFFAQWLQYPENTKCYEETTTVWEQAKFAQAYFSEKSEPRENPSRTFSWKPWGSAIAATLLLGVFINLLLGTEKPSGYSEKFATGIGQRQEYTLPDGSSIELGVNTQLSISFNESARNLELHRGEAYFKVAKDSSRRFNISTNGHVISVTGTEFNVRARSSQTRVLLVEGSVQIEPGPSSSSETIKLSPGEQTEFSSKQAPSEPVTGNPNIAMAWRSGKAVFVSAPLTEVVTSFRNYHKQTIQLDPSVASLRISGVIPIADYDIALETLRELLPVTVESIGNGYLISALR